MDRKDQVGHFAADLDALCNRYVDEYDISYAETIGALQFKIWTLCNQAMIDGESRQENEP